ncbi:MAG: hypothetical protein ACK5MD_06580 [Flavobacteriales bacterium]
MFDFNINPNLIIGFGLAFLLMGIINIVKPDLPFFSIKGNPKQTRIKGIIRVAFATAFILIYYFKAIR